MKVLQINTVCSYSSPARIMVDLCDMLIEKGHDCCIAYGRGKDIDNHKLIKIGNDVDIKLHGLATRIFGMHSRASVRATKKFIKDVEEYNPDLIHLHNIHGYYLNINLLFEMLERLNKPVIWTLHDCWGYTGHCTYYDFVGCEKWKTLCLDCPQLKKYPSSILFDNSKNNFINKKKLYEKKIDITLVTPSNWLSNQVKQSILKGYELQVINNGIDLNIFKPYKKDYFKHEREKGKKIILGVANVWDERKGYERFLKLANKIDKDFLFVLIGLSKLQIKELPQNIKGISRTNNIRELACIYSSADIYLNLSVEETMGLTTIEALACGTQVIVLDATAIPEFVNNSFGRVLDKDCVIGKIVEVIKEMTRNPISIEKCRNWATQYDKYEKYQEYLKVYDLKK